MNSVIFEKSLNRAISELRRSCGSYRCIGISEMGCLCAWKCFYTVWGRFEPYFSTKPSKFRVSSLSQINKILNKIFNYINFPKISSRVRFPRLHMKICNGRIDFKFSLKSCSCIIVYGKNTFGAISDHQKGVNNFSLFFCNVCRIPLLTYMEMEMCSDWSLPEGLLCGTRLNFDVRVRVRP